MYATSGTGRSKACHNLAGVHPCGIISLIGELFGAESKGQVYGHLHSYFSSNECATNSLSML